MSDQIKKILEDQERLARLIQTPASRLMSEAFTTIKQTADALSSYRLHPILDMEKRSADALLGSSALDPSRILLAPASPQLHLAELAAKEAERLSGNYDAVRSAMHVYSPYSEAAKSAKVLESFHKSFIHTFRLPELTEVMQLASTAVTSLSCYAAPQSLLDAKELSARMVAMTNPWIDVSRTTTSINAFVDFQRMGEYANSSGPYDAAVSEFFRERLGDWREADLADFDDDETLTDDSEQRSAAYAERGVDRSLTNFSAEAMGESLDLAGLPRLQPIEQGARLTQVSPQDIDRNTSIFHALHVFELEVRAFLTIVMERQFGANWIDTQVPPAIVEKWNFKKGRALQNWEPEQALIEYADFSDYIAIIEKTSNWKVIFSKVFVRRQDIQETMARLTPVRNQAMHARILTLEDEMLLRVETGRFYSATRRYISALSHRN